MTEPERKTLRKMLNTTRREHMADARYDYRTPRPPRVYPAREHPSESSWSNHGCRCAECCIAAAAARKARRERR